MKDKLFKWTDSKIYLIVIAVMVLILGFYQPVIAFLMGLVFVYLVYYDYSRLRDKEDDLKKYIETISQDFDSAAKHAIFNMPFPMVFIDELGKVTWYNTPFLNLIEEDEIVNKSISELVPSFNLTELGRKKENDPLEVEYLENNYKVYPNFLEGKRNNNKGNLTILYWVNDTDYIGLKKIHYNEKTIITMIDVDNYDDIKNTTPDIHRPIVLAEIDQQINAYFSEVNGIVRKYENDKYLIIMDQEGLEQIKSRRFDLLDQIKELKMGNTIPITLSIGICQAGKNLQESYKNAIAAIDIALGRGGDQAVINIGNSFDFYGGKSKALEKRNKVKARVIGDALRQLIDQSDKVFVMGHKNPDMDSIGASVGIMRAIFNRKKEGYLILNEENPSIRNLMKKLRKESQEITDRLITTDEALQLIDEKSLLIVVDNHKPGLTEAPELLDKIDKIVVIDHHRRGAEFIKDPVLIYLEPYASSTSELVTEVLTYMSEEINLTKFEAEALLSGITVDTKNFSFQTGVRTFEAASILKRAGADTTVVKQLFRDDFTTFINKADVVRNAKIILNRIAVGRLEKTTDDSILVAAQAANELLNINDVDASFVLTKLEDKVHISGRSLGNISVQLILEKLGGGGHLTSAGAQIEKLTMDETEKLLINIIEKYLKEGEKI